MYQKKLLIRHTLLSQLSMNCTDLANDFTMTRPTWSINKIYKELHPPKIMANQAFEREKMDLFIVENGNAKQVVVECLDSKMKCKW
uniref:CSON001464 protein n=1 Tax=Culicoides sonorensis TaxID=179676 RepID=A0A336MJA9_CULSO